MGAVGQHTPNLRNRRTTFGTMLYVGEPAAAPSEPLLNCVREIVKRRVSIAAAYAFVMAVGEGVPSFSIGIYFDHKPSSHEVNELFSQIGYYMKPFLSESEYVDLLPLDPSKVLAVTVRDSVKPFYQRKVQ